MSDNISNNSPGGLAGVIKQGMTNFMKDVHTALPGKIVEFDPVNQTAKVQLLIRRVFKGDRPLDLPQLINVVVWQARAGGYSITFPIQPEDECLVLFSERSLDNWFKQSGVQTPTDFRMHSLSDAICLVGMSSEPKVIQEYDSENFQIRNELKDQTFTLKPDKSIVAQTGNNIFEMLNNGTTNITSPVKININTPLAEYDTDVKINGKLDVVGNTKLSAILEVTGNTTLSTGLEVIGNTTLGANVTSNNKDISDTHTHGGGPVPD
tara:strand:+ start:288 stop:1082 length:795 start_codon:yes stop_codon:yes gene_type:complete